LKPRRLDNHCRLSGSKGGHVTFFPGRYEITLGRALTCKVFTVLDTVRNLLIRLLLTKGNIAGDVWLVGSLVDHLTCHLTRETGMQQQAKQTTMYSQAVGLCNGGRFRFSTGEAHFVWVVVVLAYLFRMAPWCRAAWTTPNH
jgi:hypothetical protein